MPDRADERDPADEGAHAPGPEAGWREAWVFEFGPAARLPGDGRGDGIWGSLRLVCRPDREPPERGRAEFRVVLGPSGEDEDRGTRVVVDDRDVSLPRPPGLTVRAEALWAELLCETPFEHWTLGLEAFGLRVEASAGAPDEVREMDAVGERLAVGLDLEWEVAEPGAGDRGSGDRRRGTDGFGPTRRGYEQVGHMHGEVLLGRRRVAVDAPARRAHWWGAG